MSKSHIMGLPAPIWSVKIAVADIPEIGAHFDLVADEGVRAALARAAGIRGLPRLEASFDVSRHGRGGLRIVGIVSAALGQNCVVTLDPLDSELEESVDLLFSPPPALGLDEEDSEMSVSLGQDEPPETLTGGSVDLGAIATEFLLLGINPYPRKHGADFAAPPADDPASHPFAALAALKKGRRKEGG